MSQRDRSALRGKRRRRRTAGATKQIAECSEEIRRGIPPLRRRYGPGIVTLAMVGQSAASLRVLVERGLMAPERAEGYCHWFTEYVLNGNEHHEKK